jgi:hypothetical protein
LEQALSDDRKRTIEQDAGTPKIVAMTAATKIENAERSVVYDGAPIRTTISPWATLTIP